MYHNHFDNLPSTGPETLIEAINKHPDFSFEQYLLTPSAMLNFIQNLTQEKIDLLEREFNEKLPNESTDLETSAIYQHIHNMAKWVFITRPEVLAHYLSDKESRKRFNEATQNWRNHFTIFYQKHGMAFINRNETILVQNAVSAQTGLRSEIIRQLLTQHLFHLGILDSSHLSLYPSPGITETFLAALSTTWWATAENPAQDQDKPEWQCSSWVHPTNTMIAFSTSQNDANTVLTDLLKKSLQLNDKDVSYFSGTLFCAERLDANAAVYGVRPGPKLYLYIARLKNWALRNHPFTGTTSLFNHIISSIPANERSLSVEEKKNPRPDHYDYPTFVQGINDLIRFSIPRKMAANEPGSLGILRYCLLWGIDDVSAANEKALQNLLGRPHLDPKVHENIREIHQSFPHAQEGEPNAIAQTIHDRLNMLISLRFPEANEEEIEETVNGLWQTASWTDDHYFTMAIYLLKNVEISGIINDYADYIIHYFKKASAEIKTRQEYIDVAKYATVRPFLDEIMRCFDTFATLVNRYTIQSRHESGVLEPGSGVRYRVQGSFDLDRYDSPTTSIITRPSNAFHRNRELDQQIYAIGDLMEGVLQNQQIVYNNNIDGEYTPWILMFNQKTIPMDISLGFKGMMNRMVAYGFHKFSATLLHPYCFLRNALWMYVSYGKFASKRVPSATNDNFLIPYAVAEHIFGRPDLLRGRVNEVQKVLASKFQSNFSVRDRAIYSQQVKLLSQFTGKTIDILDDDDKKSIQSEREFMPITDMLGLIWIKHIREEEKLNEWRRIYDTLVSRLTEVGVANHIAKNYCERIESVIEGNDNGQEIIDKMPQHNNEERILLSKESNYYQWIRKYEPEFEDTIGQAKAEHWMRAIANWLKWTPSDRPAPSPQTGIRSPEVGGRSPPMIDLDDFI
jgi:hypothetical protein